MTTKKDILRKFRYKLFAEIFLKIMGSILLILLMLFLADTLFNDFLANIMSAINRPFYLFLVGHKFEVFFVLLSIIILISVYFSIKKSTRYIELIIQSIDKVFQKDETLITLPGDFKDIENQLNTIKYDALRNEQIAHEAEQRKNDLVVYLAHDLKTPLTSVIGYLSLLNEEKGISPELRDKYLSIALSKSHRLEDLINEFFDITRFSLQNISLERNKINLSLMLCQMADEFYPALSERSLTCKVDIPPNLTIYADSDKLARVFDNLLRNAIHYSYENSEIEIEAEQSEKKVHIIFRNYGDTIPEHKLSGIFEKFYRVDSSRSANTGGAGLGLAIAKEIVELHNGTITAASHDGQTEFHLFLPIRQKR